MKRLNYFIFVLIMLVLLLPKTIQAKTRPAGMTGSQHDFSWWNVAKGQICIVCHTPHNARTDVDNAPLWNHRLSQATYTLYSSPSLDSNIDIPDGASKLCLGCHDGTVGVTGFGNNYPAGYINTTGGTNLSIQHPISFVYSNSLVEKDGFLNNPYTTPSGLGKTISEDMLFQGRMQCNSCHDVHNSTGLEKLLIKSNEGSALCFTCHKK